MMNEIKKNELNELNEQEMENVAGGVNMSKFFDVISDAAGTAWDVVSDVGGTVVDVVGYAVEHGRNL